MASSLSSSGRSSATATNALIELVEETRPFLPVELGTEVLDAEWS